MSQFTRKNIPAYQQAYEQIRDKILNGELPSGTKIPEEKLAAELGFSRTPIRESLRELESEGLIKNKKVVQPTEKDLREIFQMRILLEGFSSRVAATYLGKAELDELYNCVQVGKTGTLDEIMDANEKFHMIIVNASGNSMMINTIGRMKSIIYLLRKTAVLYNRPRLIDEHEEIYEAIKARNGELAEQLMKQHLQVDMDFCLYHLSRSSPNQ